MPTEITQVVNLEQYLRGGENSLKPKVLRGFVLADETAVAADGVTNPFIGFANYSSLLFKLRTTSLGADATDVLDVLIQRLLPATKAERKAGTLHWDTIARFAQIDGADSADIFCCDMSSGTSDDACRAADDDVGTIGNVVLASDTVRSVPWGDVLRVAWIVTSGNAADFDFQVSVDGRL